MTARELSTIAAGGRALVPMPPSSRWYGQYTPVVSAADTQTYEPGLEPTLNADGSWTYTLPARSDASSLPKRRVERLWTVDGRVCTHTRGDTVVFDGEFTGVLGPAANSVNQWHVLWQLHGPGGADLVAWRPPPQGLAVKNGRLELSGGEGHVNNQYTPSGYYGWLWDLGPWVDNVRHHIRVEIKVGNDPDGWITCDFDGQRICERWRPQGWWRWDGVGWTGNYPGTLYSQPADINGDWLQSRSGLYRGPQNGEAAPTTAQWIRWWPYDLTRAHQP